MKKQTLLFGFLLASCTLFAQSNPLDKKMQKAYDLVDKDKYDEADKYLVKLLEEHPEYGTGWDYLSKLRYQEYKNSKVSDNLFGGNITITTTDKDGKKSTVTTDSDGKGGDSTAVALMKMLNRIKPSELAYNKYLYTLREATLMAQDAEECCYMIRRHLVDPPVDTAVSKKALGYFQDAEEAFGKKNYEEAAKLYKRAVENQPDFYKANLYLGDCYYATGNYADAISSFKTAVNTFPNLIEPRKFLTDAYLKEKLYANAMEEAIKSMAVYPEMDMGVRIDDAAYMMDKKVDIKWSPRPVFPNKMPGDTSKEEYNVYHPDKELSVSSGPWTYYTAAFGKIKDYCNDKGIIVKSTPLTQSHYMEVYSWEEMLKNSNDPALDEARRMQKDGYLDCYVLVSCFHYDFYDQYLDFAAKNKDRIMEYYKKYIVAK